MVPSRPVHPAVYPVRVRHHHPRDLGVTGGSCLRHLRQGAGFRHGRLALAPAHPPALEPEHPAGPGADRPRDLQAHQRLHLLPEGWQGHPVTLLRTLTAAPACSPRRPLPLRTQPAPDRSPAPACYRKSSNRSWSTGPVPEPSGKPPAIAAVTASFARPTASGTE